MKFFFLFATGVNDTGGAPSATKISANFGEKNDPNRMLIAQGLGEKLIHEKTCSRKSRGTDPLISPWCSLRKYFLPQLDTP